MRPARAGFTLLELIMVIVVVAIAAVAIGSGFAYIARTQAISADLQRASQIAQECADYIIGLGRRPGSYAGVVPVGAGSAVCNVLPAPGGAFTRTVDITNVVGAGAQFCSAGWTCKHVRVSVRRGGNELTQLNFMFVNY